MHRRRSSTVCRLVVVAAIGAVGCGSDTKASGAGALPCTGNMTSGPPSDFTVYFDAIALPSFPDGPRLDALDADRDADGRRFTKFGLFFRPTRSFALAVADDQRGEVGVGWGYPPVPHGDAVSVPCAGAQQGWAALPGGVWSRSDICARIEVSSGDERAVAKLPLGGPCG